jgi:hypothetical protein
MISGDSHKIWEASNEIIKYCQDTDSIQPLIKWLEEIKDKTHNINLGGGLAPNKRFLDKAIETIEHYKYKNECTCQLYIGGYYDGFNPKEEEQKGNIKVLNEIQGDWMADYTVQCSRCHQEYDVIQREGHYTWYKWTKRENN